MGSSGTAPRSERSGLYLAITVIALLIAVYLALQVIGFLFKLAFLVLAVIIAMAAFRAWRERA